MLVGDDACAGFAEVSLLIYITFVPVDIYRYACQAEVLILMKG